MATSNTLTAAQLDQLAKSNPTAAERYVISHAGTFGTVPGSSGPGGIPGALDKTISAVPTAVTTASQATTSVGKAISYVVDNAKYAAIWVGLMILAIILVAMGLGRNGLKPPIPPVVVAP